LLPIEQTGLGTNLVVETPWGKKEATVVPKPFVDPKKDIPKS
jgi:aminomethyltransferase